MVPELTNLKNCADALHYGADYGNYRARRCRTMHPRGVRSRWHWPLGMRRAGWRKHAVAQLELEAQALLLAFAMQYGGCEAVYHCPLVAAAFVGLGVVVPAVPRVPVHDHQINVQDNNGQSLLFQQQKPQCQNIEKQNTQDHPYQCRNSQSSNIQCP